MTSSGWSPLGFNVGPVNTEPRVLIALPVYSGLLVEFVGTLLNTLTLLSQNGIPARVEFLGGDSLIPRARNNLAHHWIHQTQIPFFLQLDTDLVLDAEGIKRLICHPPEYAVIGGCYPKKKPGPAEWVCNPIPGVGPREDGLQEVWENGTGLLRIHRSVYAAVKASYPQLVYICDGAHDECLDLFPVGTFPDPLNKRNRYLSEDWYVCQLARAIGFKIWADTKCAARHIGQVAYPWPPELPPETLAVGRMFAEAVGEERETGKNARTQDQPATGGDSAPTLLTSCLPSANSPVPHAPPPATTTVASTPPTSSSAPSDGLRPITSSAPSAAKMKRLSGRGRTRKTAATSAASR
jgi:hypothetical protein